MNFFWFCISCSENQMSQKYCQMIALPPSIFEAILQVFQPGYYSILMYPTTKINTNCAS